MHALWRVEMLEHENISLEGKNVVVVGASNIVGKPMALMLMQHEATVCICHAKTRDLAQFTLLADVLVVAAGYPNLILPQMVRTGAVVIDVGINRLPDGRLVGDVDFAGVAAKGLVHHPGAGWSRPDDCVHAADQYRHLLRAMAAALVHSGCERTPRLAGRWQLTEIGPPEPLPPVTVIREQRLASYVLAIDQGTTSTRAMLVRPDTSIAAVAQQEFAQHFPADGEVEHEPDDLWSSTLATCRDALRQAGATARDIAAIGIANQRETTLLWDRDSGRPVHRAIVWQDRRSADLCARLKSAGHEPD